MSEAVIHTVASDIKGGKWFGPVSMGGSVLSRSSHFHGSRHFVYTQSTRNTCNPSWFTSPIRFALPWCGPDCFQPAD